MQADKLQKMGGIVKLKYIVYIVGIISLISVLQGFVDDLENSKIYNYESQKIIEEYGDKIFPVDSITASDDKQKNIPSFCFVVLKSLINYHCLPKHLLRYQ